MTGRPQSLRRGLVLQLGVPVLAEIATDAGFDFVVIDLEHGLIGPERVDDVLALCRRSPARALVRLPFDRREEAGRLLDAGADGIVLADVRDVEQVAALRREMSFPPGGTRGAAPSRRSVTWGRTSWASYLADAAEARPLLWALLESREGAARAAEIAASGLVDGLWIGLYDLALLEGWDPPVAHRLSPELGELTREIGAACRAAGVEGIVWSRAADHAELIEMGYESCYVGTDAAVVYGAFAELSGGQ